MNWIVGQAKYRKITLAHKFLRDEPGGWTVTACGSSLRMDEVLEAPENAKRCSKCEKK